MYNNERAGVGTRNAFHDAPRRGRHSQIEFGNEERCCPPYQATHPTLANSIEA
ncbi:MAG: hypothetical protein KAI83_06825 [Thiomargarita sp.]|nr:hypothetical protein [Thiomargarita sp.]